MADEVFRQARKKAEAGDAPQAESPPTTNQGPNPLDAVKAIQEAAAAEVGREPSTPLANPMASPDGGLKMTGNVPPELREAMQQRQQGQPMNTVQPQQPVRPTPTPDSQIRITGSDELEGLLQRLTDISSWEEIELPSKGKFYTDIPAILHIRPMTGEEEQILATPRWVKKGKAIDMIFSKCIREPIQTEKLLSVDRNFLLIFLRGISYTPEYDVEIKCPECSTSFSTIINLDTINVDECPDAFGLDSLVGELPTTGFGFKYRLATGADEQAVTDYRERRIKMFGDQSEDDTLLYRTAVLLDWIEGVTNLKEIQVVLKRLPINDVAHLRNTVNEPPFGVDTDIPQVCPACAEEFNIDLPLETNFFFPRKKEEKTPA